MQSILLVNLMRMGDTLQTTPLIQALRETVPEARISMVLNEAFGEAARRIDLDQRFAFPLASFREMASQGDRLREAHAYLKRFLQEVNAGGAYDLVFNLTPSRSAGAFSSMIEQRSHRGMWLETDGSFQAADPWAAYLVAMTANRRTNPFHLVDIWLRTLGHTGPRSLQMTLTPEDVRAAEGLLKASGLRLDGDLLVGFQVSASQPEKCWSEKEFVRLGRSLTQTLRARVVLFGQEQEEALCRGVSDCIPGSVNLAGQTSLGVLAAALKRCRVLVTNDTGTQHVATAVGTRVVVVSVGPVFFRETGPYGEGHLIFQARVPCAPCSFRVSCLNPVCKEKVRAEQIYKAIVRMLRGEDAIDKDLPRDVSCYRSGFDDQGGLEFVSSSPTPEDRRMQSYKGLWRALLEGGADPVEAMGDCLDSGALYQWGKLEDLVRRSSRLMAQIRERTEARAIAPAQLRILGENLRASEEEIRRLALEAEELAPLVHFLFMRREALSFQDSFRFLEEASSLYSFTAEQISRGLRDALGRKEAMYHAMQP
jgi:ADP-heptose:LPS heptosyltransferase